MKKLKDLYYREHKRCPKCGNATLYQNYVGFIERHGVIYKDMNDASCKCGWRGMVHDLIK